LLRHISQVLPHGVEMNVMTLGSIPLYDGDLDGESLPPAVAAFKQQILAADGLVVCSPEYNYGMPGVLKNAIDWASRPAFASPLKGKVALIITSSPGTAGGVLAQAQIRDALTATLARPISVPHVAIPGIAAKLATGQLNDEPTLEMIARATQELISEIQLRCGAHVTDERHLVGITSRAPSTFST
jgi:chromate reductase